MPKSKSPSRPKDTSSEGRTDDVNKSASTLASDNTRKQKTMAEGNETSIIEFSEDIGQQEAPVPLPVGEYSAEIRGAVRKTSGAGNPYAQITFFVAPEQYPADYSEGDPDGMALIYNRASLQDTPAARHRLRKLCEAIGAPTGKAIDLNDWVGRTATIAVQHDTYEGETRAVVGKVVAA